MRSHLPRVPRSGVPKAWLIDAINVGLLVLVATGAVVTAALVPSLAAAANGVYGLASTALVCYASARLGIFSKLKQLLSFRRRPPP